MKTSSSILIIVFLLFLTLPISASQWHLEGGYGLSNESVTWDTSSGEESQSFLSSSVYFSSKLSFDSQIHLNLDLYLFPYSSQESLSFDSISPGSRYAIESKGSRLQFAIGHKITDWFDPSIGIGLEEKTYLFDEQGQTEKNIFDDQKWSIFDFFIRFEGEFYIGDSLSIYYNAQSQISQDTDYEVKPIDGQAKKSTDIILELGPRYWLPSEIGQIGINIFYRKINLESEENTISLPSIESESSGIIISFKVII